MVRPPLLRPRRRGRLPLLALLLATAGGLAACGIGGGGGGSLRIVAAENFWGNIAQQIGGSHVSVTSLITNPNADPHLYESNAADAAEVASASLLIQNGLGYDDFMSQLISGAGTGAPVITVAQVLGVSGNTANPHLWYDIPRIPAVAQAIESRLAAIDPTHAADYRANLTRFDASLAPLDRTITAIAQHYPGAPVAYTERVPGYLLEACHLANLTPAGFAASIENGSQPSLADTAALDRLITGHRIRVLLYNVQTVSSVTDAVRQLAQQNHVAVVGVSETMPQDASSYQSWQQSQLDALQGALGG